MSTEFHKIEKDTISYIIKTLLNQNRKQSEFKNMYEYITSLMVEEEVYSLSTTVRTFE